MDNMITYAETRLDTFEERSFGSVDSLILSWVSYIRMPPYVPALAEGEGIPISALFRAEHFNAMFQNLWAPEETRRLLTALAASPRFRDVKLMGYIEETDPELEKQFSAVTFRLLPDLSYVAFRGTNTTLVGWKEDFNMAFQCPVASQEAAVGYLTRMAKSCPGRLMTGGHSKGGNLAVYAASMCGEDIQRRIEKIYSHDGPGFLEHFLESEAFGRIQGKIEKTVPQSSVVGMLLESHEPFRIVKSNRASFWQHDPFSWEVDGDRFVILEQLAADAKYLDSTLTQWLSGISGPERERFVDALYQIVSAGEAVTFGDLFADWQKNGPAVARAAAELDRDTRDFLLKAVKSLATSGLQNVPVIFRGRPLEDEKRDGRDPLLRRS